MSDQRAPAWTWVAVYSAAARDLCMIGAGWLLAISTPPSLEQFDGGKAGVFAWAMMLMLGALVSLTGVLRDDRGREAAGCAMVGVGFLVWAIASTTRDDADTVSYALALVFLGGAVGQVYRIVMVAVRPAMTTTACRPHRRGSRG